MPSSDISDDQQPGRSPRPSPPLFATDEQFWYETLRLIGAADHGGSLFGEVLATAGRITPGNYSSWHDEWLGIANRVAGEADAQAARGHVVSARDGYLRASNYYRSAEFFLHERPDDPRIDHAYRRSVDCYREAARRFPTRIEPVEIPYEGTSLPGYFHSPDGSGARRPLILLMPGFDGSCEELHFLGARAAVERGYNVLAFDGPGQFGPVHRERLLFRPDWEAVVGPVIDYALTRGDVDPDRIVLHGESFGGLLAPRAAAFEPRLAALICDDGVFDFAAPVVESVPAEQRQAFEDRLRAEDDPELDAMLEKMMADSVTARWAIHQGMYTMGAASPRAFGAKSLDYNLRGIAERITCPTLVCEAEEDLFFKGQPERLFDALTCPKTLLRFTSAEGAGTHCEAGAGRLAYARIYDWLDEQLAQPDTRH